MAEEHRHYDDFDAGPEWGTPEWVWQPLGEAIGGFDLDPASGAEPEPIAAERFTPEDNGLEQQWFGHVWLNPPYGRQHNPRWGQKVSEEASREDVRSITCLVPASMETNWFQDNYGDADLFCFLDTRLSFHGSGDSNASFPNVLAVFGWDELNTQYMAALQELGLVMKKVDPALF